MVKGGRFFTPREKRPVAAVYRGEVSCDGCAESVAHLLRKSPMRYKVHYLGPKEDHDINQATLSHLDIFAWPGGGDDEDTDYLKVQKYTKDIQDYVHNGGRYAGFCLGAFFARGEMKNQSFFGLLPQGSYASGERFQSGAQVKTANDTIILTDWTFGSGEKKGQTVKDRWQYFQDGAQFYLDKNVQNAKILGRYVYTKDPSAVIVPYGKGSVGLIGFHPEADQSWYDDYNIVNPQNVSFELGYDFLRTLHESQGTGVAIAPKASANNNLTVQQAHKRSVSQHNTAISFHRNDGITSISSLFVLILVAILGFQSIKRHH